MKKILLLLIFSVMLSVQSSSAAVITLCFNGHSYTVFANRWIGIYAVYDDHTSCSCASGYEVHHTITGWVDYCWSVLFFNMYERHSNSAPATEDMYDNLNNASDAADSSTIKDITDYITYKEMDEDSDGLYYTVNPFLLHLDIASEMAKSEDLQLFGIRPLGNPSNGNLYVELLSTLERDVDVTVTGISSSYSQVTSHHLTTGSNTIYLQTGFKGTASIRATATNEISTEVIFY